MRDGFSSTSVGKRWDLMKCSSGYHWQPFLSTANRVPFLHHLYVPTIFKCHQCLSKYLHILVITLLETHRANIPLETNFPSFWLNTHSVVLFASQDYHSYITTLPITSHYCIIWQS